MIDKVECVVVGAGVVGLAVARALAMAGREVIVIEANFKIGTEVSSRNNEVVHSGYLYPPGSLKEKLCKPGREMLYAYCEQRGIQFKRLGKVVVAVNDNEIGVLQTRIKNGQAIGILDMQLLDRAAIRDLEPKIDCPAALFAPSTGIVDTHALMLGYQGDAENHGAMFVFNSRVVTGKITNSEFVLDVQAAGGGLHQLQCDLLVNAAGLSASKLALALSGYPAARVPRVHYPKGVCYALTGATPFRHLVVSMGETMAAGAGFTLDLAGRGRFGPDVFEWPEEIDYSFGPDRAASFGHAIRRFYAEFDESRLHPSYAAIRPRIAGPGQPMSDWLVEGPEQHGVDNLVHMFGIESPGLTASLALGDYVAGALSRTAQPA